MKRVLMLTPSITPTDKELELFRNQGIEMFFAMSADEALAILRESGADLLVAELDLPGTAGGELCAEVKSSGSETYVILASEGKKHQLKICGASGADAHVTIPINMSMLLHRIAGILKMSAKRAPRVLVKLSVRGSFQSESFFGVSHNISTRGMRLEAEQSLARGDIINCSFYLPEGERLACTCRVVHIAGVEGGRHEYGVEFIELEGKSCAIIEDFVRQQREEGNLP